MDNGELRLAMSLWPTLSLLGLAIAFTVICGWQGARLPDLRRGPRLVPWRLLMLLCGAVTLGLAAHTLSLLGVGARPRY